MKHVTLLISVFVISKVIVRDVLKSPLTDTIFKSVPETEFSYFQFYGLTLTALLTDFIYDTF